MGGCRRGGNAVIEAAQRLLIKRVAIELRRARKPGRYSIVNRSEVKSGADVLPLTAWLDVLSAALPPAGVLLVGAGAGKGAWVQWLQSRGVASGATPVHLVEGDERQYRYLQKIGVGCTLWRDVVAPSGGSATFHRTSNPAESGLLPPQSLQQLWPHLGVEQTVGIEDAMTLDALQAEAGGSINWLVLDCLPAAALLQGGERLLTQLDVALVRVANTLPTDLAADQQAVDQLLHAVGLRCVHTQAERHPGLAHALYIRDTTSRLERTHEQLRHAQLQGERASEEAQAALQERLQQAQEAWAEEKAALIQAQEALQQQLQQAQSKQSGACEQGIKDLEKQLHARFDKSLANSVKQIENFISIQNYLSSGEGLSNFHGWPISPDIGLFLIEQIRERRHDLIIEFGSGTSTALFARTLKISRPKLADSAKAAKTGKGAKSPPAGAVRPVCTFEHDKLYLRKTQAILETQGLLEWVALNHAPLVDWQDDSGQYLYYDCDTILAAAAKQLGQFGRVLVLVDGPPGATCENARYPAVPHVFKHFARHEVDVVLDDASRPEEKTIIELWRAHWEKRAISTTDVMISSEKGLYWARNYDCISV